MPILHCDFESYSRCDLKARGLDFYSKDPSTGIHCMGYAFDDEPVRVLTSWAVTDESRRIAMHVFEGHPVVAHNAAFELALWNHILAKRFRWPDLRPEQCRDTMVMAYAMGLPGALEAAAPAVGLEQRKDSTGHRTMLQLCRPRLDGQLWRPEHDPEKFQVLYDYCAQDVEVERALHHRLMEISPSEQDLWTLDYQINQRGVLLDLPAIDKGLALIASETPRLNREMLRVTSGAVGAVTEVTGLVRWIRTMGVEMKGAAKAEVLDALDGDLPWQVRAALELRKEGAKSSTAKLVAMKEKAGPDGRLRNLHQFHGASTGRWAGRGVQIQNLPRPRPGTRPQDVEDIIRHLGHPAYLDAMYGPTLDALADSIRGLLIASPGHDLVAVDFSAVEARVLAWLAGEEDVLDAFRAKQDIYKVAAARIYHVPVAEVTKDQRQIGKVAVLALGYGGSVGAFDSMAANYNVKLPKPEIKQIVKAWRAAHPNIVRYWKRLEQAAIEALETGCGIYAGPEGREVAFKLAGSFLWCKLPSGRVLCYPYPELRTVTVEIEDQDPWETESLTYMTVVSNVKAKILPDPAAAGTWKRIATYGGSLAENVTQAVARDLLAETMKRMESEGFAIVGHIHDEVIVEVEKSKSAAALARITEIMSEPPAWAPGLPLAAEGFVSGRYRKG